MATKRASSMRSAERSSEVRQPWAASSSARPPSSQRTVPASFSTCPPPPHGTAARAQRVWRAAGAARVSTRPGSHVTRR
eukprot:6353388-Prymnesium_polylepis.1